MDRKALREYTHKAENLLDIGSDAYKQWVFRYTFLELEKDLGIRGDITTASIFHAHKEARAAVFAKQGGIFAGRSEIEYFLVVADPKFRPKIRGDFRVKFFAEDGEEFRSGVKLLEIEADIHDLMAVERCSLNLMMRMSGVATFTKKISEMVKKYDVLITPTRKSLWGLLDKRAVLLGGGGSHRISLSDAVLVKDNHVAMMNGDYEKVFQQIADSKIETRFVEVEVNGVKEALALAKTFSKVLVDKKIRSIGVILMDNMSADEVATAVTGMKKAGVYDDLLLEASGGINEKNVVSYAKTGVDIVSMGCLTGGVKSIDMSLKIM